MNRHSIVRVLNVSLIGFLITIGLVFGIYSQAAPARAIGITTLVGGFFGPGLYDIFTPVPFCGLGVTVIGPAPGFFLFAPPVTQVAVEHFMETPFHVGNNALGYAVQVLPNCPPTLFLIGSSLTPGF